MTGRSPDAASSGTRLRTLWFATPWRAFALAAVLALSVAGSGAAASASPSAAPEPATQPGLQVWLDQPLPPEAGPGTTIVVGITVWSLPQRNVLAVSGASVRLHPATGSVRPTEAAAQGDWPGHLVAAIVVPKGGAGQVEVGFKDHTCNAAGSCSDAFTAFAFGGVGPPPEAPRSLLIDATVHEPSAQLVAGQPIDVVVDIAPKAAWDRDALGLTDLLIAIVSRPRSPDVAKADLHSLPGQPDTYSGQVTIADSGDVALVVAIPGNGTEDQVLATSTTRLTIGRGADVRGSPAPGSGPATASNTEPAGPPWILIGAAAALLVTAGFVASRVFADL